MARSNLAYLHSSVEEALERQVADPLVVPDLAVSARERAKRRIAGIEVHDGRAFEGAIEARRGDLVAYRAHAAELKQKLDQAGVTHIAIWPTKGWQALCRETELHTFNPAEDGSVRIGPKLPSSLESIAVTEVGKKPYYGFIGGGVTAALLAGVSALALDLWWPFAIAGTLGLGIIGAWVTGKLVESLYFSNGYPSAKALSKAEYQVMKRLLGNEHQQTVRALWPDMKEPVQGARLRIELPPAPADVQENLVRAAGADFKLTLHVLGEGIAFVDDPLKALLDERRDRYEEIARETKRRDEEIRRDRELRRMMQRDPIVTTSHGTATAIIVQYGEFPMEKEVIDRILNSTALV